MSKVDEEFTIQQAAAYLNRSVGWLYRLRAEGRGPVSWIEERRLVYPRSGLNLYRARARERSLRGEGVVTA